MVNIVRDSKLEQRGRETHHRSCSVPCIHGCSRSNESTSCLATAGTGHQPDITPLLSQSSPSSFSSPLNRAKKKLGGPTEPSQPETCSTHPALLQPVCNLCKARGEEEREGGDRPPRIKSWACVPAGGPGPSAVAACSTQHALGLENPFRRCRFRLLIPVNHPCSLAWLVADEQRSLSSRLLSGCFAAVFSFRCCTF